MAFKNLSERFLERIDELYQGTAREGSSPEPYIEIKPNDSNSDILGDSRSVPNISVQRDVTRMTKYLTSQKGLLWMLDQQILQTGNTFQESRLLNPLFVLGNTQPYINLKRPFAVASDFDVEGDQEQISPGSTNNIGRAGRMQLDTARRAISIITSGNSSSGIFDLLKYIPPGRIISAISGFFSLKTSGATHINMRPEMDMDGNNTGNTLFSVMLREGFVARDSYKSPFKKAAAQIRTGNIPGAIKSIASAPRQILREVKSTIDAIGRFLGIRKSVGKLTKGFLNTEGVDDLYNYEISGKRYFITGKDTADRYLEKSVEFDPNPKVSMSYLNRLPYNLVGGTINIKTVDSLSRRTVTSAKNSLVESVKSEINKILKGATAKLKNSKTQSLLKDINIQIPDINPDTPTEPNPAEAQMRYPELALRSVYQEDDRINYIRQALEDQKETWQASLPTTFIFGGGFVAGKDIDVDPYAKIKFPGGNYFFDDLNSPDLAVIDEHPESTQTSPNTANKIKELVNTLVDFMVFDFVNKKTIPFRAYITGLTETVNPIFSDDTRYVGRVDRNVVYSGVNRELNFQLKMHALNADEMDTIYTRLNYLTGLCYPAAYADGFMVPPFIKLTLGDLYVNQPGYFRSLTHTVEDDTPWEIETNFQAPHGITTNITFSVIEKEQMQTSSKFYNYGIPRYQSKTSIGTIKIPGLGIF